MRVPNVKQIQDHCLRLLLGLSLVAFVAQFDAAQIQAASVEEKFSCPHGWTRYGSKKCLKYVNELQDYERAQAACRSKNQGSLVTIHSQDEQNFVYSYIHSIAASSTPIWLGAKQIDFESILWLDKTENSFTNWAPSEPSPKLMALRFEADPDEICIAINPRNGNWHDVMCAEANIPACERAPTTQWPFFVAFCSEGWFQFNDEKCVRIIGSQALNFYESQELCRSKYNSKLLSIKSEKENEFLHNLIKFKDIKLPVWLGAVQNDLSSFNWMDKSDVTFTNWADSEPNDPDHSCISMVSSNGKWSDHDCKEQKLILCQKIVPDDSSCETGWLQFRQDKCYRFVHVKMAYDEAESLCNSLYGGHLPSIHSQEEQFMLTQFLASVNVKNGSEIWLGGRQMDMHNFNWADGSLFNYTFWEHGEPNFPSEKCIEMSWRNGRWNDINCKLKRAVLCERQLPIRSELNKPKLYQPGSCLLDSNCNSNNTGIQLNGAAANQSEVSGFGASSQFEIGAVPTSSSLETRTPFPHWKSLENSTTLVDGSSTAKNSTKRKEPSVYRDHSSHSDDDYSTSTEATQSISTSSSTETKGDTPDTSNAEPITSGGDLSDPVIKITDLGTDSPLVSRSDKPTVPSGSSQIDSSSPPETMSKLLPTSNLINETSTTTRTNSSIIELASSMNGLSSTSLGGNQTAQASFQILQNTTLSINQTQVQL